MWRPSLLIAAYLTAACTDDHKTSFGTVTEDMKSAIREWCTNKLEMETHLENSKGVPILTADHLLLMRCYNAGSTETLIEKGRGWLAFDSVTMRFVDLDLELYKSNFDSIVNRILPPLLDTKQKLVYDGLRAFLDKPTGTTKEWSDGKAYMVVAYIPSPDGDPEWDLSVGYRK